MYARSCTRVGAHTSVLHRETFHDVVLLAICLGFRQGRRSCRCRRRFEVDSTITVIKLNTQYRIIVSHVRSRQLPSKRAVRAPKRCSLAKESEGMRRGLRVAGYSYLNRFHPVLSTRFALSAVIRCHARDHWSPGTATKAPRT